MFSNQAGVLYDLQCRAGGEEDEKKMGRQGQVATSLIVFAAISTLINTRNLSDVFASSHGIIVLMLFVLKS